MTAPGQDQLPDRSRHVLDGHVRIDTMLVEQIDSIGAQPLEYRIDHFTNVLRSTIETIARAVGIDAPSELRGDEHLITKGRERFAHQFLIYERAIRFGRI